MGHTTTRDCFSCGGCGGCASGGGGCGSGSASGCGSSCGTHVVAESLVGAFDVTTLAGRDCARGQRLAAEQWICVDGDDSAAPPELRAARATSSSPSSSPPFPASTKFTRSSSSIPGTHAVHSASSSLRRRPSTTWESAPSSWRDRVLPENYAEVTLNDTRIDWMTSAGTTTPLSRAPSPRPPMAKGS